ncbi:hypothetical protein [Desulfolucanica intricata]|uniref:hypothetical protein n=1 Tax=Desulfolucanica intricata TaxID=1285191 RepID=UPI00083716C1|nr:hypothetical protein [Desulfolucanica intricata]
MSGFKITQIMPAPGNLRVQNYDDNSNIKSIPVLVLAVTDFGSVLFGYLNSNGEMAYTTKAYWACPGGHG